ncbi:MAG TPA: VOC family protein [Myxococcaceae bacterium]|nr:VOC family protein [Myxococcaceae bacterium]
MPHRSRLAGFMIDFQTGEPEAAAAFWGGALGFPVGERGTGEDAHYIQLKSNRDDLCVDVQRVDHPPRVHLDIETDDLDAEVRRLEALGAKRVAFVKRWWVMEAPTGHRFCVVRMHHPERGVPPTTWP